MRELISDPGQTQSKVMIYQHVSRALKISFSGRACDRVL